MIWHSINKIETNYCELDQTAAGKKFYNQNMKKCSTCIHISDVPIMTLRFQNLENIMKEKVCVSVNLIEVSRRAVKPDKVPPKPFSWYGPTSSFTFPQRQLNKKSKHTNI